MNDSGCISRAPVSETEARQGETPLNMTDLLKLIRDDIPCGLVVFDAQGAVRLVNRAMSRFLDEPCDTIMGRTPTADAAGFASARFSKLYDEARRTLRPVDFNNISLVNASGERIHLSGRFTPLGQKNNFHGMVLTAEHVTAAVRLQRKVDTLSEIHARSPLAMIRAALDGSIVSANAAGQPLMDHFKVRIGDPLPAPLLELLRHSLASGSKSEMEIDCLGSVYQISAAPFPDTGYADLYALDISRSKRNEDALHIKEQALSVSQCAVCMADLEGRLCHVNPAFLALWNYDSKDEVLGRATESFWESPRTVRNVVHDLMDKGSWSGELVGIRRDGSKFRTRVSAGLVLDAGGEPLCLTGSFVDITEQTEAVCASRHCELKHRALVESTSDWIWEVNARGLYTWSNSRIADILGYTAEEMLGRSPLDFMPPEEKVRVEAIFQRHLRNHTPIKNLENTNIHRSGRQVVLETSGVPVFDDFGTFQGFRGIDRDITERKTAQLELQEARDDLEIKVEERTRELEQSKRNLEAVFRSISDAILTVDKDLNIIKTNEALDDVCDRADRMLPGVSMNDIFEEDELPPCLMLTRDVLRTRDSVRGYRAECRCGQKSNQVTMVNASPLYDPDGSFTGAVIVIRDVTRLDTLEKQLDERCLYRSIVGRNRRMREIYAVLDQLTDVKTTVLITGESGTGKELIVEALHYGSSTITGPLVKVNCSALAESLLESELFGHVRGAFTGAVKDKIGRFQAAEGGTIFLDEIGDISPNIQLKLLRVLERKEYERVGDSTTRKADVRVVAATNNDLFEKVRQGVFRKDLYYRLRVMVIDLPPLRERADDIPLLCEHFMHRFRKSYKKDIRDIDPEALEIFTRYLWPGNVRELKHTIEHAFIVCEAETISVAHLPIELHRFARLGETRDADADPRRTERLRYLSALEQSRWNRTRAAGLLGISRTTLYRKMEELEIRP